MAFNAAEYAKILIEKGCDPETAHIVANKQAQVYRDKKTEPQTVKAAVPLKNDKENIASNTPKETGSVDADATDSEDKPLAVLTKHEKNLIDAGIEISSDSPAGNDLTFMHSVMCQIGLPRSKVDGLSFERVCGSAGIYIQAGRLWDGKKFVQQQIPYGPMPRLVMAYLNTQALRYKSPEIDVGRSAQDFLKKLGKRSSGGVKGTYTTFKTQMLALAACNLSIGITTKNSAITYDGKPIKQFEAWLNTDDDKILSWPKKIIFSQEYYETLCEHAVPIDLRALNALSSSPLAMDIYIMLSERLHRINDRKPVRLFWTNLRDQFGQEYVGKNASKDFKRSFLIALKKVQTVYPSANIDIINKGRGGLLLMSSPPPVPYKNSST